jgi:hypothetical protein
MNEINISISNTECHRVEHPKASDEFTLLNQSWRFKPVIMVDNHKFIDSWEISKQLLPCGRCRCQFLQTITAILSLLYHFGHFHVYVEFEEEAETRVLLWKWLCCGCCRKRPSYLFESLQEGDSITTAITTRYTPPPGFTGHNDLYESCRTDGCPRHSVSTNNEMRDLQCLYKGMPQTHLNHMGRYRWFLVGSKGCGVVPHTDPGGTCAWNAIILGSKRWIFFPPDVNKEELLIDEKGDAASWYKNSYAKVIQKNLNHIEVIHRAGEIVYVPPNWWHVVMNLEFTVALTQSFGSAGSAKELNQLFSDFQGYDKISADIWWSQQNQILTCESTNTS